MATYGSAQPIKESAERKRGRKKSRGLKLAAILILLGVFWALPRVLTEEIVGLKCAAKGEAPGLSSFYFSKEDATPYLCNPKTKKCRSVLSKSSQKYGIKPGGGFSDISEPANNNPLAYVNASRSGDVYSFDLGTVDIRKGAGSATKARKIIDLSKYTSTLDVQIVGTSGSSINVKKEEVCSLTFVGRRMRWWSKDDFTTF